MKEDDLKIIQRNVFDMFLLFDSYCRQKGLRYYLLGGSMLGAVRHHGFIPWDDDIDVGMPRNDYKYFIHNFDFSNLEGLFLLNRESKEFCSYDFSKLIKTVSLKDGEKEVFLDIFPLDGCPFASSIGIKVYYNAFNLLRLMKNSHYMSLENKNIIKKTIIRVFKTIPLMLWYRILDIYLESNSFEKSKSVGNFSGHWGYKEIMQKYIYGEPKLIQFENNEYYGIQESDLYLKKMYGDYMRIPSTDERQSHYD